MMNKIADDFTPGKNFKIGYFCVIEEGVTVGNNVELGNHVFLRKGTHISDDTFIDTQVIWQPLAENQP